MIADTSFCFGRSPVLMELHFESRVNKQKKVHSNKQSTGPGRLGSCCCCCCSDSGAAIITWRKELSLVVRSHVELDWD